MPRPRQNDLTPYLARLRALRGVIGVEVETLEPEGAADHRLTVRTRQGTQVYQTQIRGGALGHPLVEHLGGAMKKGRWLLAAPYIPAQLGEHLTKLGIDWIDDVGNCHLELGRRAAHVIHIEGRRPAQRLPGQRPTRAPGYQVLLVLLAHPELTTVRAVAAAAGVGKTVAAELMAKLRQAGELDQQRPRVRDRLIERWVAGYAAVVRPTWLLGQWRTQARDPGDVERQLADVLADRQWALGGAAGALRLAAHYRARETVVHVPTLPPDFGIRMRALRTEEHDDGNLVILATNCPIVYEGAIEHTAHPLVVYAELLAADEDRAHEAADVLRKKLIAP